jgi:hypothetical protein
MLSERPMPFAFRELDQPLRALMVSEINRAITAGTLYLSKRFNDAGRARWPDLLREAARDHDEHWLAYQLEANLAFKGYETRAKPKGGYTVAHVPDTAAVTLADGEFNRSYMCAVCQKAIAAGTRVAVYRAKRGATTRPGSDALIGTTYDPATLLAELRTNPGHPLTQPNSGLSIETVAA